jgi:hypothetical protein
MRRTRSCCWRGPLDYKGVLRRLMRWPGLPDLPVQESRSVKMKKMKSSLLDEERGNKAKVSLKMIHVSGRICWLCWLLVFVAWGMFPKSTVITCLSFLLGLEVVVGFRRTGRLSSSLLLICDRSSFVFSFFVFELGLAKTLFCYPVIMEPDSCEAYGKKK